MIKTLLAMAFVLLGVVFGALNRQPVHVDVWIRAFDIRLGLLLLIVLLLGAVLGGAAVTAGVVWPLRRRLHRSGDATSGPDLEESSGTRRG